MTQHRRDAHDFESEGHPHVAFRPHPTLLSPRDTALFLHSGAPQSLQVTERGSRGPVWELPVPPQGHLLPEAGREHQKGLPGGELTRVSGSPPQVLVRILRPFLTLLSREQSDS